ncbi:hypothetical protein A9G43_10215 [Gilliamella sp. Occ3-1]|nr:hypothetical protein A9G43_10215 [Gilliamella apicola]
MIKVIRKTTVIKIHKKTKLTPYHRQEIWRLCHKKIIVIDLAKCFMVGGSTIYNVLKKAQLKLFVPLTSKNASCKTISYLIKL